MRTSDNKFAELILYVAKQSDCDPTFGAVKLNKILWASDFIAYGKLGKAITGQEYFKLENGPAPRRLLPVRSKLEEQGRAAVQKLERYGFTQQRLVALEEPDLSDFTGEEIAIVDDVIRELFGKSADDVSRWSHQFPGWMAAALQETIPYETVFVSRRPLTETEIQHGQTIEPTTVQARAS